MTLERLNQAPMSSRWNFVGAKNGYMYYRSNTGKLFAKYATPDGSVWYRVKPSKANTKE
jgi:hypothetical protein